MPTSQPPQEEGVTPDRVRFAVHAERVARLETLIGKTARQVPAINARIDGLIFRVDQQDEKIELLRGAHESALSALRLVAGSIERLDETMSEFKSDLKGALVELKTDLVSHKKKNDEDFGKVNWVAIRAWALIPPTIGFIAMIIYTAYPYVMKFLDIKIHFPTL